MCAPQRRGAALGQTDVLEVALLLQCNKGLHHILNSGVRRNPSRLKNVHLLKAAEGSVDCLGAPPQVLGA